MDNLVEILRSLHRKPKGHKLGGGLILKMKELGNVSILSLIRTDDAPSEDELHTVACAIVYAFEPVYMFAEKHHSFKTVKRVRYGVRRIMWVGGNYHMIHAAEDAPLKVDSLIAPPQQALFDSD